MINKYKRVLNNDNDNFNIWPTFTDMLAGMLLIFILIVYSQGIQESNIRIVLNNDIQKIVSNISKEFDTNVKINGETGGVTFFVEGKLKPQSSMFDVNETKLTKEGKAILKEFIPKYVKTIYSNEENSKQISKIVIEGYTDDDGDYLYNLELSQQRAFSVAKYILGNDIGDYEYKSKLKEDLIAVGRSEADLIKNNDGSVNKNKSRRVELKYEISGSK